ncbi:hypothetical protein THAOC_10311 [Thalassiosira oceanica]|uniref:Uncharacterized protein n=1 Tax=Thalassiosira oceanica TaxID=159749 RepID=K0SU58_THAOC|nr:hypothetical protein THAOC_10311 [Thalassiosira oceanica]|eukprot:EJK68499.1 hypothetical protein THAOC_10311 [Thalassiosira oceanica]
MTPGRSSWAALLQAASIEDERTRDDKADSVDSSRITIASHNDCTQFSEDVVQPETDNGSGALWGPLPASKISMHTMCVVLVLIPFKAKTGHQPRLTGRRRDVCGLRQSTEGQLQSREHIGTGWATKVRGSDRFGRAIMASESASPDDYMDMDATDLPPWPSSPNDVPAGSAQETGGGTDVDHSTAALLVQDTPQHGLTASTVRALNDDDPPMPLLHAIGLEKATEEHQLHDGPPGPPCISHAFDDSQRKKVDNDVERPLPDSAQDSTPTVDSTMGASTMTEASVAAGQSMAKDVEEGNVSSGGTAPPMSSCTGEVSATAAVERDAPPAWCSTSKPQTVLPFYQRQSFVSNITCTLFVNWARSCDGDAAAFKYT